MLNKILPLVLVLFASLIMGNQAAFAQTTDVWGLYCENDGADDDANPTGTPGASSVTPKCDRTDAGTSDGFEKLSWALGSPLPIKSVREQNPPNDGSIPDIFVRCYSDTANPDGGGQFDWDFTNLDGSGGPNGNNDGQANRADCANNFRADNDLGFGPVDPVTFNQPLEVQPNELVVLDVQALIDAGYGNFMVMFSSNQADKIAWLATSSVGPNDGDKIVTETDLNPFIVIEPGSDTGNGIDQGYNSFPVDRWLYFKNTGVDENLIQQIKATIPPDVVGGHGGPIDKTALMVTGAQLSASWMIPVLVSAIGIGVFVVTRKS